MKVNVEKCDDSLVIRLPMECAARWGVEEGSIVDVSVCGRGLVVEREQTLEELTARITVRNWHRSTDWGPGVGCEAW